MAIRGRVMPERKIFFVRMILYRMIEAYEGQRRQKTRNKPPRQVTESEVRDQGETGIKGTDG
jgi:hypothetical protein